jgi:hypothetical protein
MEFLPIHFILDYFQEMSPQYARKCCKEFDKALKKRLYMK